MSKNLKTLTNGIIRENPVLVLVLGTCPTLATTTSVKNGLGMGLAATFVLICSNAVISMLKKAIPDKVRIPSYIVVIAGFVTIVQMVLKAFLPTLDAALGIYIPLIVVNCIILGRAEMFANKNTVFASILDGAGMGIGFTLALFVMGCIRELLGAGKILGYTITANLWEPIKVFVNVPGGFFVFGCLIALMNKLTKEKPKKKSCGECHACGGFEKGAC